MIVQLLVVAIGCRPEPDPDTVAPGTATAEPVVCAHPGARAQAAFDLLEIPADAAEEHRFMGAGVVAGDFDRDGDVDLLAPGPRVARLLVNDGAGGFADDPDALPDVDFSEAVGGAAADFDADGDLDVIVTRYLREDVLLRNEGGRFVVHELGPMLPSASQSPTWGDLDLDGDLDLLVAGHGAIEPGLQVNITEPGEPTRVWLGDGAGGFTSADDLLHARVHAGYTFVIGLTDVDADGDPDLLVANDYATYVPTLAARNGGDGRFVPDDGALGLNVVAAGMGLGMADINGDGLDDYLLPVWDRIVVLRSGATRWVNANQALGFVVPRPETDDEWIGWGGEWTDLDNDGDLDGLVAFGHLDTIVELSASGNPTVNAPNQRMALFVNDGTGEAFVDDAVGFGLERFGVYRGFAVTDVNGDGWPDVAARDLSGAVVVWQSRCGEAGWLTVRLDRPDLAVGAEVEVHGGGRVVRRRIHAGGTSLASGGPPEAMIGLGDLERVDDVVVRWSDGVESHTGPLSTRQVVQVARPD